MDIWIYCPICASELTKDALDRPTCKEGHFTKYPTPVAATLAFIRNNNEYLVLRRAKQPQIGVWDLPGGFTEYNEDSLQTLFREIEEETQLKNIHSPYFLGTFPSVYGNTGIHTLASAYIFESDNRIVVLSEENDQAEWMRLEDIPELAFDDCRNALRKLRQEMV